VTAIDVGHIYATDTWQGPTYEDILGFNIRECCGSTVLVSAAVHVTGWGPDGLNEAILVIIDGAPVNMNFVWQDFAVLPVGDGGDQEIGGPFALSLGDYEEAVRQAVIARDFEAMAELMQVDHTIGYWQSEGVTASPVNRPAAQQQRPDGPDHVLSAGHLQLLRSEHVLCPNVTVAMLYSGRARQAQARRCS
jgi:hypothetical protein